MSRARVVLVASAACVLAVAALVAASRTGSRSTASVSTMSDEAVSGVRVAAAGDIYYGLWYPIIVALMSLVIGTLLLRDNRNVNIHD